MADFAKYSGADLAQMAVKKSGKSIRQFAVEVDVAERTVRRWIAGGAMVATARTMLVLYLKRRA